MERTGLRFENFCSKRVKNHRGEKSFLPIFFLLICSLGLNVFWPPLPEVQKKVSCTKKVSFLANFALLAEFFWYWCYYPHRSRKALSPVCWIFFENMQNLSLFFVYLIEAKPSSFMIFVDFLTHMVI